MNEAARLRWDIEEKILEVANMYEELTTSDLQGVATVKSQEIINMVRDEIIDCGILKPGESLRAVQCMKEKGLV